MLVWEKWYMSNRGLFLNLELEKKKLSRYISRLLFWSLGLVRAVSGRNSSSPNPEPEFLCSCIIVRCIGTFVSNLVTIRWKTARFNFLKSSICNLPYYISMFFFLPWQKKILAITKTALVTQDVFRQDMTPPVCASMDTGNIQMEVVSVSRIRAKDYVIR